MVSILRLLFAINQAKRAILALHNCKNVFNNGLYITGLDNDGYHGQLICKYQTACDQSKNPGCPGCEIRGGISKPNLSIPMGDA